MKDNKKYPMIENNPMVNQESESEPLFADPWDEQTDFSQQRNRRYYCQFCNTTLPKVIPIFCPECKKRL